MKKMDIGFIGFGLIGGSIARALKSINSDNNIIAYDYYSEKDEDAYNPRLKSAYDDGLITSVVRDIKDLSVCDIIYLCCPVKTNINYLQRLKDVVTKKCIITDVGSVKDDIHKAALSLDMEDSFVGGHPMAGSEKTGYANSNVGLMSNAYYIITSTDNTPKDKIDTLYNITKEIGAIPIKAESSKHDEYVAAISHVPHIVAVGLVNMVRENDEDGIMKLIAAGGFKDITRIGSSSPEMWESICLNNSKCILKYIDKFRKQIDTAYEAILNGDGDVINRLFADSKMYRDSINNNSAKTLTSFYELFADIDDRKGIIAKITSILSENDINIKNIGIIYNRENVNGVLRIEFKEFDECELAYSLLQKENITVYK